MSNRLHKALPGAANKGDSPSSLACQDAACDVGGAIRRYRSLKSINDCGVVCE